jgi:hypothetical protein
MAKKPEAGLTSQPPAGRLPFDQVVEVEGSISGTRNTLLPLRIATLPSESTAAFDASAFDEAAFQNATQPLPLPQTISNAVVDVAAPPSAGAAPSEINLGAPASEATLALAADLTGNADVVAVRRSVIKQNLAANTADNRTAAQALLQATQAKIAELRDARLNDPETADLIKFLEWLAQGLTQLVDNLDCAIAQPAEPMFLGTAADIAHQLKLGLFEAIEKRRVRVWEVGAIVGVACFLSSLSGEKLASILKFLFK